MTIRTKPTPTATVIDDGEVYTTNGFEKTVTSVKDGMENAARGFEVQQAKMREGMAKAMKTTEDLVAFGQGNVEAFVKAGQIYASGLQGLSRHLAASAQASVEETVATAKALSGAKSMKEAVDLQSGFARSMMEKTVAETGRITEASLKLTEQAIAPITARVALAVEKFGTAI